MCNFYDQLACDTRAGHILYMCMHAYYDCCGISSMVSRVDTHYCMRLFNIIVLMSLNFW